MKRKVHSFDILDRFLRYGRYSPFRRIRSDSDITKSTLLELCFLDDETLPITTQQVTVTELLEGKAFKAQPEEGHEWNFIGLSAKKILGYKVLSGEYAQYWAAYQD